MAQAGATFTTLGTRPKKKKKHFTYRIIDLIYKQLIIDLHDL